MKFRVPQRFPHLISTAHRGHLRRGFTSLLKKPKTLQAPACFSGGGSSSTSQGSSFVVPGATLATIAMLGLLHARRIYEDRKLEQAREKGIEIEFQPDTKASFLTLLPLRSISRFWGLMTSVEFPVWLRPQVYRAWARAFHSNLEEVAKPLNEYASLREFFVRALREGSRPIDSDPSCLVSPVDGTIVRFGELRVGTLIEQVKGYSYSLPSLLGTSSVFRVTTEEDLEQEIVEQEITPRTEKKSWRRIALASPKIRDPSPACSMKGLFYCVIYLSPGDYHRVHSPVDWSIFVRRHFSGRLFPVNERATRTIRNLYVENERVVLEGRWREGFIAMAAVGATNIGSIELSIEPELRTNRPRKKLMHLEPPEERIYEPEGVGVMVKKGDEIAAFNMGSTVVVVFQAPISKSSGDKSSEFKFCINRGDRVRVGEAIGRWDDKN